AAPGFINAGPYPGFTRGEYIDKSVVREKFIRSCQYMLENQVPVWVGEFGPVYSGVPEEDEMRYRLLEDQIAIYAEFDANWSLWTYKDLGLQGVVSLLPNTPWMKKMQPVLEKKALLGVDSWGGSDRNVRNLLDPLEQAFSELFPNYNPFPFNAHWQIHRVVRNILLAEPLVENIYPLLAGLDMEEIDELMRSFLFENCCPRQRLCQIIRKEKPAA
ncbi:MAG TPA: hypothetical protein VN203_08070, partial [Candidatus Acidoferrum sp.]|nr:hypothetical protein [Candidatus Acidoferrum sp.]